jgi:hypothetical protein
VGQIGSDARPSLPTAWYDMVLTAIVTLHAYTYSKERNQLGIF